MTVRRVRVGDVLRLERRSVAVDVGSQYREIGVRSFGKGLFHKDPVSGVELVNKRVFRICDGDLIVSNVFAWEGAVAVAAGAEAGMIGSHRFMTWVPDTARVEVSYAYHYFTSSNGTAELVRAPPGSAGRNNTLSIAAFENLTIPLPSLDEQRAIAARLDRIEQVVKAADQVRRSDDRLVALRERVFARARRGERLPIGSLLADVSSRIAVDPAGSYPDVGILNRGRGLFPKPDRGGSATKYSTLYPIRTGQLIYSKLFAWEGSVSLVPRRFDGCFVSSEFPRFDVDVDRVDPDYLGCAVRAADFADQLATAGSGMGQRRQPVNVDRFRSLQVSDLLK